MKGLYVYGALLMALSFVTGVVQSSSGLCALTIASCALAALSEALLDAQQATGTMHRGFLTVQIITALSSWVVTALAAIIAILSFI